MKSIVVSAATLLAFCAAVLSLKPDKTANDDRAGDADAGFISRSHRRNRPCAPREIDEEDVMERRRIHKCCRRYGDDYFDFAAERWRHRRRSDDDYDYDEEEESGFDRRRKRFWRRKCRRYRIRYEESQEEDTQDQPAETKSTTEDPDDLPRVNKKSKKPANVSEAKGHKRSKLNDPPVDEEEGDEEGLQSDAPVDEGKEAAALGIGKNGTAKAGTSATALTKGATTQGAVRPVIAVVRSAPSVQANSASLQTETGRTTVKPTSTAKSTAKRIAEDGIRVTELI